MHIHIFVLMVLFLSPVIVAHGNTKEFPVNPKLGVPGFPDCVRAHPDVSMLVEEAAMDLICTQKGPEDAIKIGCVGDSITAGVHSTGGNHTFPGQMQVMLDLAHGVGKYSVTNLGACGSTMLKKANSPYWNRPQYKTLTGAKWDIIIIMLGTNDAKDPGSRGPNNWHHDCGGVNHTTLDGCSFATDYQSMIGIVKTLGTSAAGPKIYTMIPPPLMQKDSIGANQTVINSVYPKLVPLIEKKAAVNGIIDIYTGMGGVTDWASKFPPSCVLNSTWSPCAWWCDKQSCDQCHPNNDGYTHLAQKVIQGLAL